MAKDLERVEMAFPVATIDGYTQYGMTLRDYFAAKAMQALFANTQCPFGKDDVVRNSYEIADAMLEARQS